MPVGRSSGPARNSCQDTLENSWQGLVELMKGMGSFDFAQDDNFMKLSNREVQALLRLSTRVTGDMPQPQIWRRIYLLVHFVSY